MNPDYLSSLANHLWQSTLVAGIAGLLTLALGRNHARVRHGVWVAASCKFLIPLSALVAMGGRIQWLFAPDTPQSNWPVVVERVSQPFRAAASSSPLLATAPPVTSLLPSILLGIWACGFLSIGYSWWMRWKRVRAAVRAGSPVRMDIPIRAVCSRGCLEPGVFGVFRPVLLLPGSIFERLTPAQLHAVIEHELCHFRHRDNLIAAVHMFVETIFWFHPPVWWIGKRMIAERERACDEEVVRLGSEPRVYAQGILNVCRSCLPLPRSCGCGVSGSDLNRRIEAIVTNRAGRNLDIRRRLLVIAAGAVALAGPIAVGIFGALPGRSQPGHETAIPAFEAASVKVHQDTGRRNRSRVVEPERISYLNVTLREMMLVAFGIKPYQISGPEWIQNMTYDVVATAGTPVGIPEVKRMLGPLLAERFHLVFHRETRELPVFALVVAKGGPKFKEHGDGGEPSFAPDGEGGLSFRNYSMDDLADWLSLPAMGRPVVDRTGLKGSFSFRANLFTLGKADELKRTMTSEDTAGAFRSTLPDQLGLRLEARKAPVEILVIDRADKVPVQN